MRTQLKVDVEYSGFDRAAVVQAIESAGLAEHLATAVAGPFGHTSRTLALLEAIVEAGDLGLAAAEALRGVILEELGGGSGFALPQLGPEHRQLIASFCFVVTADALVRKADAFCAVPNVDGGFARDGLLALLQAEAPATETLSRILRLARAYAAHSEEFVGPTPAAQAAPDLGPVLAFFKLTRVTVRDLARTSSLRPLLGALEKLDVTVGGYRYRGLDIEELTREPSGLLPVGIDDIVGNEQFLQAGLRLARDVAGFDFDSGRNPKKLNPVLFGLGRPGSGKTVTAHAIGNHFLDYCRKRNVPARFLVVRRTDWASSYQNASASNLVRFFREEVQGANDACGIYWPDIDTAFASRDSGQLRQEEKQNLGAVFGIFDGTLLPRNGKWFLICDANTLHMDEATISRIAQNPFRVNGPETPEQYVRLMRDVLLRDVASFLCDDAASWLRVGTLAQHLDLTGRNVDSICSNIRAHVQDFEYPDEYFAAPGPERDRIVSSLGNSVDEARILELLQQHSTFRTVAEAEAEQTRFDGEVDRIVRHLNASRAAAERAVELDATSAADELENKS